MNLERQSLERGQDPGVSETIGLYMLLDNIAGQYIESIMKGLHLDKISFLEF